MHYDSISSPAYGNNKYLLTLKLYELQRLESKIKKQIHNMAFQSIRKYKIAVSPIRLFSMSWSYVLTCTAPTPNPQPQKPTNYLKLHMNISQIYTLEQPVQSTCYPDYLHLSCNVKVKVTVLLHLKKITNFFYDFLLKKTFAK